MDQHTHPSHGTHTIEVPRLRKKNLPSLDVTRSLEKIVRRGRGGFCFELNFSFAWLLNSLGYSVRLALADVGCQQTLPGKVPAHVVILVDELFNNEDIATPILVDPGFGTPGVCELILPLTYNNPVDSRGDLFRFDIDHTHSRFDTVLLRTRVTDTSVEEKMYRFNAADDLMFDSEEFAKGLDYVLEVSPTFNEKRICVLSTSDGHVTLGRDYVKWIERGEMVKRVELTSETEWRSAVMDLFGVVLHPE